MGKILQNHYVLAVHNLNESSRFFEQLGFKKVSQPQGWIFVQRDNCMVMLGECRDALPPSKLGDHNYFGYLRVENVDAYYEEVKRNGVTILSAIETKLWEMREFSVRSPEGHRLVIGQWIGKT